VLRTRMAPRETLRVREAHDDAQVLGNVDGARRFDVIDRHAQHFCRLVANHLAEVFGNLFEFSLDTQYDPAVLPARHFRSNLEPVRDRQRLLAQRELPAVCVTLVSVGAEYFFFPAFSGSTGLCLRSGRPPSLHERAVSLGA
jgi:hypothetical protein